MPAPTLVHFEQQIDAELLHDHHHHHDDDERAPGRRLQCRRGVADGQEDGTQAELTSTAAAADKLRRRRPLAVDVDWMSLDEMVRNIYSHIQGESTANPQKLLAISWPVLNLSEPNFGQ